MGLETGDLITGLNEAWPLGGDNRSEGDDHLRLVKHVLKYAFDNTTTTFTIKAGTGTFSFAQSGAITVNGSPLQAGIPDAPSDGVLYGRSNAAWTAAVKRAGDTMSGALSLSAGDITVSAGKVTANSFETPVGNFTSTATSSILAATGAGTVFLRPSGPASTTGQMTFTSAASSVYSGNSIEIRPIVSSDAAFFISKFASGRNNLIYGRTANSARWTLNLGNNTVESANSGSDFDLHRYNDTAVDQGSVLFFSRLTGLGTVAGDPTAALGIATKQYVDVKAPLASPVFTGDPQAPTPATADNDTSIATTAFVKAQGYLTAAVTSVTGTAPVVSSGGNTPAISMPPATTSVDGYLTAANWTTFNNKLDSATAATTYVAKGGDTMTGALRNTFAGTASSPNYQFGTNTGFYGTSSINMTVIGGQVSLIDNNVMTNMIDLTITKVTPQITLNKTTATNAVSIIGKSVTNTRWSLVLGDTTAETGGATGSNFAINRYNDIGTLQDSPISITRSNGNVTFTSQNIQQNSTGSAQFILNKTAANANLLIGSSGGNPRWGFILGDTTVESGSNVGSDFKLNCYTDGGVFLSSPLLATRSTGLCTVAGNPTAALGIATKQYVDAGDAAATVPPAAATPLMDGTAAVGVATKYAREDHVHPTDTTRAPLASPALTGTPTAPTATAGTNTTQVATTAFVASALTSVPIVAAISDTAPGTPVQGQLWWCSADSNLYIWYNDGTSSQWVQINNIGAG